jgi:hypothetical protein
MRTLAIGLWSVSEYIVLQDKMQSGMTLRRKVIPL